MNAARHRFTAWLHVAGAAIILSTITAPLRAQDPYESEVYGSETMLPHFFMVEVHSNYTLVGQSLTPTTANNPIFDAWRRPSSSALLLEDPTCHGSTLPPLQVAGRSPLAARFAASGSAVAADSIGCTATNPVSTEHTVHETIEVTAGVTDWSEVGFYLFNLRPPGAPIQLAGGSARIKLRIPLEWRWPVGVALSTEIEHERAEFSPDTWSWEIRPVIDRAWARWYVSLNPTLERTLEGPGVTSDVQFSPSATVTFDATRLVTAGVEYFGAFGQIGAFAPPNSRLQQFFGVVDLHASPVWEINGGLGIGTTSPTSHLVGKILVGRRFGW